MENYIDTSNFITDIIDADLAEGRESTVHTRFPPEPNGYLHIGSARAIFINYSMAKKYGGKFNLRYDDTNPLKESDEYERSILADIEWLTGETPSGGIFYGSDYFGKCYEYAEKLIKEGKAYVCDLSADELREYRGTLTTPGRPSPYRDRTVEENLDLFRRMRDGEFPDGAKTLRAKIDMASPNINMRDPAIYRILHADHYRQGDRWCVYPLYDFAHPIQDATEGITHSLCSIEFADHRPLYDWVVDNVGFEHKPHQYEFARLNVTYTVMSKRYLRSLVEAGVVAGWDDPRMPTLSGLRRRGYTPSSLLDFIKRSGVSKTLSVADYALLEHCIREELNATALRRVAVLDPVKVIIDNYPEGETEHFDLPNNPEDPESGARSLTFSREIYIDASDFAEVPPPKYQRLTPDKEVRLMGAYIMKYVGTEKNPDGSVAALHCTVDLDARNGSPLDGRKVKGVIHWLDAATAVKAEVRLYENLLTLENINDLPEGKVYGDFMAPDSVKVIKEAFVEPSLSCPKVPERFQFVRTGYFVSDPDSSEGAPVFNRIVELKDGYKIK